MSTAILLFTFYVARRAAQRPVLRAAALRWTCFGIPLFLAACATDLIVFLHELILGNAPLRDHGVEVLGRRAHGLHVRPMTPPLGGNEEAEGPAVTGDG